MFLFADKVFLYHFFIQYFCNFFRHFFKTVGIGCFGTASPDDLIFPD